MKPTKETRQKVFDKTGGHCWYCGGKTCLVYDPAHPRQAMTLDHIVPRISGGTNRFGNLVPACHRCNGSKNNSTIEQFRYLIMMRLAGIPRSTMKHYANCEASDILPPLRRYTFYFERMNLDPERTPDS